MNIEDDSSFLMIKGYLSDVLDMIEDAAYRLNDERELLKFKPRGGIEKISSTTIKIKSIIDHYKIIKNIISHKDYQNEKEERMIQSILLLENDIFSIENCDNMIKNKILMINNHNDLSTNVEIIEDAGNIIDCRFFNVDIIRNDFDIYYDPDSILHG